MHQIEYEAKFLDADHAKLRTVLTDLGATCQQPRRLMRRVNLDFPDYRLKADGAWVRLRDQGDGIVTLAIKTEKAAQVDGMEEQEIGVSGFEPALALLERLGLKEKSYQESYRESWTYHDAQIELDEWPWIPPTLEVEGEDEASVRSVVASLGLDWDTATFGSITPVYRQYYAATEDQINHHPEYRFSATPPWPERR